MNKVDHPAYAPIAVSAVCPDFFAFGVHVAEYLPIPAIGQIGCCYAYRHYVSSRIECQMALSTIELFAIIIAELHPFSAELAAGVVLTVPKFITA